jgi:hypothetical protein
MADQGLFKAVEVSESDINGGTRDRIIHHQEEVYDDTSREFEVISNNLWTRIPHHLPWPHTWRSIAVVALTAVDISRELAMLKAELM